MIMSKILITGALGHIGSHFIHSLQAGDFKEVHLIDNLSTQRYCSLFRLPKNVSIHFHEADIMKDSIEPLFKGVRYVLHLAAMTDAESSLKKPEEVEKVNYKGTQRVAQACKKHRCKLIFPSTTSVYGTQSELVDENCQSSELKPQSPYAESKLRSERYLQRQKDLKFVICRLGTIFGPSMGMRFHTAVNKFIWQARWKKPITVWETALDQYRPYLALDDATKAFRHIMDHNIFDQRVYNVLSNNYTVREIVKALQIYFPRLKIQYVQSRIMNQLSYHVDNSLFKKTGFQFEGDLVKSLEASFKLLSFFES